MRHIYSVFICLLFVLLFTKCANIVPPTGGPRDEQPPILNKNLSIPNESNLTNYSKDYIELAFDEQVQVTNFQNEIYTTPSLNVNKFKVSASKNKVRLNFNQPLDSNTTYTINFGKCIKDVTEGNIVENIQVAFTTGDKIDSLSVKGLVLDHLTNLPVSKAMVGLYAANDTAALFSTKPKYYTQTDESGSFKLNYLKAGEYELIAITDKNQNFKYDINKEKIGFLQNTIILDTITKKYDLRMILEPDTLFKIISITPRDNYYQIKTTKGIYKDNTTYPETIIKVQAENNLIKLFDIGTSEDSIQLAFSLTDSLGTTIDSTAKIKINRKNSTLKELKKEFYFERIRDTTFYTIEFNEPINKIVDSLRFFKLRDSLYIDSNNIIYHWLHGNTKLQVFHPSFKKDTLELRFGKEMFTSISGIKSIKEKITYLPYVAENYGVIKGQVTSSKPYYILQLIDNQYITKKELIKPTSYTIKSIEPGKYSFRILIDDNNDGKIEQGNFKTRTIPESIYFNKEVLDVKSNWEFLDININF